LLARLLGAAGVVARFDPATPGIGPFPTDFLTVTDPAQATGLRVNLPAPDRETTLVNQLDGFNIQPRVRVRFSGPVNPETLRRGIFLLRGDGQTVRVNQVVWDPTTNTAYAEADQPLAPHTRYTLVVTTAVRDPAGDPVQPDPAFQRCLAFADGYCGRLSLALEPLMIRVVPARARAAAGEVVAASTFTTLTTTTWLEKARAAIQNSPIGFTRQAPRAVFDVNDILSLTLRLQERDNPVQLTDFTVPLPPQVLLAGVDRIAFGSFRSPNFLNADGTIPPTPTGAPVTLPAASSEVLFHVLLPNSSRPATGYPVILFGHGLDDSRFGAPSLVASTFARSGFATVAMNAVGHGSGPHGVLHLTLLNGSSYDIPAGGRSVDRNGDGLIESKEGCLIVEPIPVGLRDCARQTALDLMQLIRAIRSGLDVDGDGVVDLDPNRIYYAGQSLGAIYGTVLLGVEPDIRAAVFNAGGGSVMDIARWSPSFHGFPREFLEKRVPPLLNRPPDYNENYVLRNRPAKVNDVPGAIEIQNVLENVEWLQIAGDPLAYGGQLKAPVLWQFARGDRTVPNPQTTALLRTAGATQNVQLYRHDLARAVSQDLVENPHGYLVDIRSAGGISIALAVQSQIAGFFAANGTTIPGANSLQVRILFGRNLFEVPEALPEDLGW
jgi:pimeloyl-ACP methyl ester carboxylesterase